jgi:hypothetical protein
MPDPITAPQPLIPFRVHYVDGDKMDVTARDAKEAREIAERLRSVKVDKVKRVKENTHG